MHEWAHKVCNFAASAKVPDTWICAKDGLACYRDPGQTPPPSEHGLRQREHLARVKERRSPEQAAEILQWAMERCHAVRQRGARRIRRVSHLDANIDVQ